MAAYLNRYKQIFLWAAQKYRITELAAFEVGVTGDRLPVRAHFRGSEKTEADKLHAAEDAFRKMIRPCIATNKNGVLDLGNPNSAGDLQFCFVVLGRRGQDIAAALGAITRCKNEIDARQLLDDLVRDLNLFCNLQ